MSSLTRLAPAPAAPRRPMAAAPRPAAGPLVGKPPADVRVAASPYDAVAAALDPAGRERLAALKASGRLASTDAHGATLLANLAAIAALTPPPGAPYAARDVLAQVVAHLADPGVIDQEGRNTCGATTVQYVLATSQPAEYARLVAGLAGPGHVALRGGQAMRLPADAVAKDETSRDDVERLVQAAFQDYGGDFRGTYSNRTDEVKHANGGSGGVRGFLRKTLGRAVDWLVGRVDGARGIAEGKVHRLYVDATGQRARLVGDLPGGVLVAPTALRPDVWGPVAKAVAAGHAVPVDLVLEGLEDAPGRQDETPFVQGLGNYAAQMRSHQVLVTKIADGRVHYRNPWGYETSLSEAAFRSRLTDAIVPG